MDPNDVHESMVKPILSNQMNISMAFNEIASKDPLRYTELCEEVNKTFEEISESISQEEFKSMLINVSFLKKRTNITNLLSTLKTSLNNHMSKSFERIIVDENVKELFANKNVLDKEEETKYLIDNDSMELVELEETLRQLDTQVAELEGTNEVLFHQGKFNQQRYDQLYDRITKLTNESQIKYKNSEEQTCILQKECIKLSESLSKENKTSE